MCIISFAIRYMIIISTNTRVITPHCGVFFEDETEDKI
uniref:Uncharacterized protein n=1 Tax=Providencia rettgeri TaxID=587 RepID=A0A220DIQ5_PRORE|nr:hypothetical protein PRE19P2_0560 [Providencia rettgeri]